jgi:hypothetical protein
MTEFDDKEPLAKAYDDTDGEHIANLYTAEVVREMEDVWWIRVERCDE